MLPIFVALVFLFEAYPTLPVMLYAHDITNERSSEKWVKQ